MKLIYLAIFSETKYPTFTVKVQRKQGLKWGMSQKKKIENNPHILNIKSSDWG